MSLVRIQHGSPFFRGCGGIGRRTGFRFQRATVGVRVPSPAPYCDGNVLLVPVAQLDRALDYESRGREFESLRARHLRSMAQFGSALGLGPRGRGFESLCSDQSVVICILPCDLCVLARRIVRFFVYIIKGVGDMGRNFALRCGIDKFSSHPFVKRR